MPSPRRARIFASLLAALSSLLLAACGTPPAPRDLTALSTPAAIEPAYLTLARDLASTVHPENTKYQHRPSVVEAAGGSTPARVFTDCSGLLNALLVQSLPLSQDELATWLRSKRPLARHYSTAISRERGFARISRVQDIRAGDILAIRYPADNDNSGHTMIADAPASPREPSPPIVDATSQWTLSIIDATSSPHGPDDTRMSPRRTGLGRGTFRLYTDSSGRIIGHAWSTSPRSEFRSQEDRELLVGRVEESAVRSLVNEAQSPPNPQRPASAAFTPGTSRSCGPFPIP